MAASVQFLKNTWEPQSFQLEPHLGHYKCSYPEVLLGKDVLKMCSKFTRVHPCRSVISIKLLCNFIENTLQHGCSVVNLLHIFRIPFPKSTSGLLLLNHWSLNHGMKELDNGWLKLTLNRSKCSVNICSVHCEQVCHSMDIYLSTFTIEFFEECKVLLACATVKNRS